MKFWSLSVYTMLGMINPWQWREGDGGGRCRSKALRQNDQSWNSGGGGLCLL